MRHSVAMYSSAFETAGGMFILAINFPFVSLQKYFSYKTRELKKDNTHSCHIEKNDNFKYVLHRSSTNT